MDATYLIYLLGQKYNLHVSIFHLTRCLTRIFHFFLPRLGRKGEWKWVVRSCKKPRLRFLAAASKSEGLWCLTVSRLYPAAACCWLCFSNAIKSSTCNEGARDEFGIRERNASLRCGPITGRMNVRGFAGLTEDRIKFLRYNVFQFERTLTASTHLKPLERVYFRTLRRARWDPFSWRSDQRAWFHDDPIVRAPFRASNSECND